MAAGWQVYNLLMCRTQFLWVGVFCCMSRDHSIATGKRPGAKRTTTKDHVKNNPKLGEPTVASPRLDDVVPQPGDGQVGMAHARTRR